MYLYCSRSGTFVSQGKGRRKKKLGTSKISAHCTALIKYFEESSGKVKATVCTTHYGHDKDHRFLRLTKVQKRNIAEKMKSGMSRELVLDSIRSTFVNKLDKIHELCKKDLTNIQKAYKIPRIYERAKLKESSGGPLFNTLDLINDNWVGEIEMNVDSPVLYYKELNVEREMLELNDKLLILMTKGQKDLLIKFCNNGVLYVTILRLSQTFPLHLIVVFILDDFYETFPVCFMISNSVRSQILKICFNEILTVIGPVALRAFATDDQEYIYEAWCDVMGPMANYLIANRYVDTEWRRNLTMVENEAFQGEIYDKLYDFIENDDGTKAKMESLIVELRSTVIALSFATYLEKNFLKNIHLWSTCYLREKYHLREPIDFETSYNKISSLCDVCCKYNKSVSYVAKGLIKLLLDFQSNRNRKVAEKVVEINNAHNLSAECKIENVFPMTNGSWKVNVGKNTEEFFEVKIDQCNFDDCVLTCAKCEACIHNFCCGCDSYVDGNTCVHIHLVGCMQKNIKTDSSTDDRSKVLGKFDDIVDSLSNEPDLDQLGETNTELRNLKLETLKILEDIRKKLISVNDENNLNRLHVLIKDVQGNIDVLLTYGSHAKHVEFAKISKPIKKKISQRPAKKHKMKTRRNLTKK